MQECRPPRDLLSGLELFYDAASSVPQQHDSAEVAFFAGLVPAGTRLRVLDIGCAEGALSVAVARAGHDVTAADLSPRFLEQTAERAGREGVEVRTVVLNVEEPGDSLAGETFDVVMMMDVLEHLKAPAVGLRTVRGLLAPEGTAFIHTPNCCALSRFLHYLVHPHRRFDYYQPRWLGDLHLEVFDQMTLEKTLNFVGLRLTRVIPTVLTPPFLNRFGRWRRLSRWLARRFPHLADTLLFACSPAEPVDIDQAIAYWADSSHRATHT